jgi:hypothetical protein
MAQGAAKLARKGKKAAAAPARAKKVVKATIVSKKGRRFVAPKQSSAAAAASSQHHRQQMEVSKAIEKKNEALVGAKAIAAGAKFGLLHDIQEKGQTQLSRQLKERDKQQQPRKAKVTQRLHQQLQKLKSKK